MINLKSVFYLSRDPPFYGPYVLLFDQYYHRTIKVTHDKYNTRGTLPGQLNFVAFGALVSLDAGG